MNDKQIKYGNEKNQVDNISFASKNEASRYAELKFLIQGREIFNLKLQPKFPIVIKNFPICTYIADFQYLVLGDDIETVEDCKGSRSPELIIQRKLMEAVYGVKVLETWLNIARKKKNIC